MYQKTTVVRTSARTLRPGGEGGRRNNSGRGEPGSRTGRRGRRRLMRARGGLGRPTRVATYLRLFEAAGSAGDESAAEFDPTGYSPVRNGNGPTPRTSLNLIVPPRLKSTPVIIIIVGPRTYGGVLASFVGSCEVPRAAARLLPANGGRERCGCCFLRHDRRPTALSGSATGAGHEAAKFSCDASGSVGGAGAPSTSTGRAGAAGASCAGRGACWGGGALAAGPAR